MCSRTATMWHLRTVEWRSLLLRGAVRWRMKCHYATRVDTSQTLTVTERKITSAHIRNFDLQKHVFSTYSKCTSDSYEISAGRVWRLAVGYGVSRVLLMSSNRMDQSTTLLPPADKLKVLSSSYRLASGWGVAPRSFEQLLPAPLSDWWCHP